MASNRKKRQTPGEIAKERYELVLSAQSAGEIADEELDNVAGGGRKATQIVRAGGKCVRYFGLYGEAARYCRKAHDDDPNVGECDNFLYLT